MKTIILFIFLTTLSAWGNSNFFHCSSLKQKTISLPKFGSLSISFSSFRFGEINSARFRGTFSGKAHFSGSLKQIDIQVDSQMLDGNAGRMEIETPEEKQIYQCVPSKVQQQQG